MKDGLHVDEESVRGIQSNIVFATPQTFKGKISSRRDDLIQISYLLNLFACPEDSWTTQFLQTENPF